MMRKLPFIILIVCFSCNEESIENYIEAEITSTIKLPKEINETSGLEIINNNFITHNDSGGNPVLYEFNQDYPLAFNFTWQASQNLLGRAINPLLMNF